MLYRSIASMGAYSGPILAHVTQALIAQWKYSECFHTKPTVTELRSHMQTIVDACGCHANMHGIGD